MAKKIQNLGTTHNDWRKLGEQYNNRFIHAGRPPVIDIAEIINQNFFVCKLNDNDGVYIWNKDTGILSQEPIEYIIYGICKVGPRAMSECLHHLSMICTTQTLADIKRYTAVGNGVYDHETHQLLDFSPNLLFTRKIQTAYNPNATCPTIDGMNFDNILLNLAGNDPKYSQMLLQIIANAIRGRAMDKIIYLYGTGNNGKGTFQSIIKNLVGIENIHALTLDKFDSEFYLEGAVNKLVIMGDDLNPKAKIKNTAPLKTIATNDIILINRKNKPAISVQPNVFVIQSSNGFPEFADDSYGLKRRFIVLPFTTTFSEQEDNKRIKGEYIQKTEVKEYILKLALEQDFTEYIMPEEVHHTTNYFLNRYAHIEEFAMTLFDSNVNVLPKNYVYWCYINFCSTYNLDRASEKEFFNRLKPITYQLGWDFTTLTSYHDFSHDKIKPSYCSEEFYFEQKSSFEGFRRCIKLPKINIKK